MKRITLLLTVCIILLYANASIVIDETFNFTATNLAAEASWTTTGTLTTGTGRNIESGGLVYSNTGGNYIHSGLGKKINQDYSAGTNYIAYKSFPAITTGSVYLSFIYQANGDQGQTASEVLGLSNSATNSAVKIWAGKQADGTKNPFRIGLTRSSTSSGDIVWCPTTLSTSGVYLIVIKYDLATTTASLFINPVIGSLTEPTADVTAATDGTARTSIGYLMFKHNGASVAKFFVGGVRVSTSWVEATASQAVAPKLATPAIGSATSVGATGFTANWTSVANATGYDVKVYLGSNLISTTNVSGQSSQSLAITGLMSGLTYTYKVIAKGDITNYSDSDPSAASTTFSTSDPYASNAINTNFDNGSWGVAVTTQPTSGTYPSSSINGFDLSAAALYERTIKGIKGETHINRIAIDKLANGGKVTLPTVNSVEQIEIHASAGTEGNGFQLKEFDAATNTWNAIGGTYVYELSTKNAATDSVYIITVSRSTPTKFRIENPTNGGIYLMQVITRTTNPASLAKPVIGEVSGISTSGFTANWTAVANATGYKVYVYQAGVQVPNSPFSVNGQSAQSLAITDLMAETVYTCKVQAIGDGDVNYSDSFLSFAATVTTGTTTALDRLQQKNSLTFRDKNITASTVGNFKIFNLQGVQIYTADETNSIEPNLQAGFYIVNFITIDGQQLTQKISIK